MKTIVTIIGLFFSLAGTTQNTITVVIPSDATRASTIYVDSLITNIRQSQTATLTALGRTIDSLLQLIKAKQTGYSDKSIDSVASAIRKEIPVVSNSAWEALTYSPTITVPYSNLIPNKTIKLTGDLAVINTNTKNGSTGTYAVTQDAVGRRSLSINGTLININMKPLSETLVQWWTLNGTTYGFSSNYINIQPTL